MTRLTVDDPYTGEDAAAVTLADEAAVSATLDRAREAVRELHGSTVAERVALCERVMQAMEARTEEIAGEISRMMGKPVAHARGEVGGMALRGRSMASIAEASLMDTVLPPKDGFDRRIARDPLGVVFDLPAWNYPLLTAVNVVIPAVLTGNAVVVKHSPRSPLCGEHFARAFREAGAPEGWVQALHCDHPTSERIAGDSRVNAVMYTGSVYGGHRIQAAAAVGFAYVGLELGGNDPAYVAPDADIEKTVANVVDGAMYNAGQSCCAVERVYVHRAVYKRFVEAAEALVRTYAMGDPRAAETTLGPMAQPHHVGELTTLVDDARRHGATVVTGGRATTVGGRGRFFEATLLTGVTGVMRLMQEESFGPVLPVAVVDSDEEALARMNASRYGLTASVWTSDPTRAEHMARRLDYGTVYMNRCDALDPALPWSGTKDSGRGVTLSALGFAALTRPKALHFRFVPG